jgi:hypothetical protein
MTLLLKVVYGKRRTDETLALGIQLLRTRMLDWCAHVLLETTSVRVRTVEDWRNVMPGKRGFAAMSVAEQRRIASIGGKRAHAKGRAHEWTQEEARVAGRKGGLARRVRIQQKTDAAGPLSIDE